MSQDKATRESIAKQISIEFGIAYSTAYNTIHSYEHSTIVVSGINQILKVFEIFF